VNITNGTGDWTIKLEASKAIALIDSTEDLFVFTSTGTANVTWTATATFTSGTTATLTPSQLSSWYDEDVEFKFLPASTTRKWFRIINASTTARIRTVDLNQFFPNLEIIVQPSKSSPKISSPLQVFFLNQVNINNSNQATSTNYTMEANT
jgi:hypothetical protein